MTEPTDGFEAWWAKAQPMVWGDETQTSKILEPRKETARRTWLAGQQAAAQEIERLTEVVEGYHRNWVLQPRNLQALEAVVEAAREVEIAELQLEAQIAIDYNLKKKRTALERLRAALSALDSKP